MLITLERNYIWVNKWHWRYPRTRDRYCIMAYKVEGKERGQTQSSSCIDSEGSDQPWLMDECPTVGNVSTGLLKKCAFAVFSRWHLVLQNKKHEKQKVWFRPSGNCVKSIYFISYLYFGIRYLLCARPASWEYLRVYHFLQFVLRKCI